MNVSTKVWIFLSFVSQNGQFIKFFYNKVFFSFQSGKTPLYLASREGHQEIVQMLMDKGAEINVSDQVITSLFVISFVGYPKKNGQLTKVFIFYFFI